MVCCLYLFCRLFLFLWILTVRRRGLTSDYKRFPLPLNILSAFLNCLSPSSLSYSFSFPWLEGEYEIRDVNERPSNRPNINSLVVSRSFLGFSNSIHQEVASDSFCFLINSSWLLVFILFLFLHALGLNLYCWNGIHFS